MYPAIEQSVLNGTEPLVAPDGTHIASVIDFWKWAYSDLIGNAERGTLAEYIVACALGTGKNARVSWDKYDLQTKDGYAVEVKASGYLQTWEQNTLSRLVFGIQPTYGWNNKTNEYERVKKRQADVYVFCVHKHTDQDTANPLLISQWDFYLMSTKDLNEKFGDQKTVSFAALLRAGAQQCDYANLSESITRICRN